MSELEIAHHLQEWQLQEALNTSWLHSRDLWQIPSVREPNSPNQPRSLSSLFPGTDSEKIKWAYDKGLPEESVNWYGIENRSRFKEKYWTLRPDFSLNSEKMLIFLEAKGGSKQSLQRAWRRPKELLYYDFLNECRKPEKKGMFYIVPKQSAEACMNVVRRHFIESTEIQTGVIHWEDLFSLPMMIEKIIDTGLSQMIQIVEVLKALRELSRSGNK